MQFKVAFTPEPEIGQNTISAVKEPEEIGIDTLDKLRADYPNLDFEIEELPSDSPRLYRSDINSIKISEDYARKTGRFSDCNRLEVTIINGYDKVREHLKLCIRKGCHFNLFFEYELQDSILDDWKEAGFPVEWTIE